MLVRDVIRSELFNQKIKSPSGIQGPEFSTAVYKKADKEEANYGVCFVGSSHGGKPAIRISLITNDSQA